ncbi:hypothetical protein ASG49_15790 [Marmoricola sp. Leaf446]|uniref:hypothetical protein n=1 Tax=Marmoricola sp. Leaf446 TaxID=1736379 RepID=UPI0006FC907C|nr:hypothetical protein [Marmoricola sp. Leaf446]KQT89251.1 hypothetical protein ASG49_15790 [Marmoricola sp. Leaf446]
MATHPHAGARSRTLLPDLWVVLLSVLLLGPVLSPGFVLTYDMVWVPDLALTRDALGVGSALPRAVPSDAVVAVLDEVVPGALLQKVVLLGCLLGAGTGVARLARPSVVVRLVTASVYLWNPFVVERLTMGHWPVLVGYAVAPWVVLALRSWRRDGRLPLRLLWLLPLGSLSASTGVVLAVLAVVLALVLRVRRAAYVVVVVVLANAPWLASGLLHVGVATSDAGGAAQFALHDEGAVPGPLAALTLGGIWNAEVVPDARTGALGWLALVVLVGLAALGVAGLRRHLGGRAAAGLAACAVLGWAVAVLSWAAPGAVGWLAATVPGGGLVRDTTRLLALTAPVLALLVGEGAGRLVQVLPRPARPGAGVVVALLPIALLPGVAWGAGGRLVPTDYPPDHAVAREAVRDAVASRQDGDAVLLPFSSYRQPAWNGDRKVLDPTGRYLGIDVVADDALSVDGVELPGEDPRAARVGRALEEADPRGRAIALREEGVGLVVVERGAGAAPVVTGRVVHHGPELQVLALGPVTPAPPPRGWWAVMAVAWAAYVVVGLGGAVAGLVQTWRRRRARVDA